MYYRAAFFVRRHVKFHHGQTLTTCRSSTCQSVHGRTPLLAALGTRNCTLATWRTDLDSTLSVILVCTLAVPHPPQQRKNLRLRGHVVARMWTVDHLSLSHAASKWYMSQEQMPDELVPRGKPYLAGWAYVLTRDVVQDLVALLSSFAVQPAMQPGGSFRCMLHICTLVTCEIVLTFIDRRRSFTNTTVNSVSHS